MVGSHEALGWWDPSKGAKLVWTGKAWETDVPISLPGLEDRVDFKFVRMGEGQPIWEKGRNRVLDVGSYDMEMLLTADYNGSTTSRPLTPRSAEKKNAARAALQSRGPDAIELVNQWKDKCQEKTKNLADVRWQAEMEIKQLEAEEEQALEEENRLRREIALAREELSTARRRLEEQRALAPVVGTRAEASNAGGAAVSSVAPAASGSEGTSTSSRRGVEAEPLAVDGANKSVTGTTLVNRFDSDRGIISDPVSELPMGTLSPISEAADLSRHTSTVNDEIEVATVLSPASPELPTSRSRLRGQLRRKGFSPAPWPARKSKCSDTGAILKLIRATNAPVSSHAKGNVSNTAKTGKSDAAQSSRSTASATDGSPGPSVDSSPQPHTRVAPLTVDTGPRKSRGVVLRRAAHGDSGDREQVATTDQQSFVARKVTDEAEKIEQPEDTDGQQTIAASPTEREGSDQASRYSGDMPSDPAYQKLLNVEIDAGEKAEQGNLTKSSARVPKNPSRHDYSVEQTVKAGSLRNRPR